MISYETKKGTITVSNEYFAKLIGNAASSCFGVAGMAPCGKQKFKSIFNKEHYTDKGVSITGNFDKIDVDLHIIVAFGMNINAIAKSITHKVKYVVEETTGIEVGKVTVRIDGIKE
jgi:uncharacterized alkaline shock family protein YloU